MISFENATIEVISFENTTSGVITFEIATSGVNSCEIATSGVISVLRNGSRPQVEKMMEAGNLRGKVLIS